MRWSAAELCGGALIATATAPLLLGYVPDGDVDAVKLFERHVQKVQNRRVREHTRDGHIFEIRIRPARVEPTKKIFAS